MNGRLFTKLSGCHLFINETRRATCKPQHWNLGIGIEIGIGNDATNAIISSSVRPMDIKPSRVVI